MLNLYLGNQRMSDRLDASHTNMTNCFLTVCSIWMVKSPPAVFTSGLSTTQRSSGRGKVRQNGGDWLRRRLGQHAVPCIAVMHCYLVDSLYIDGCRHRRVHPRRAIFSHSSAAEDAHEVGGIDTRMNATRMIV